MKKNLKKILAQILTSSEIVKKILIFLFPVNVGLRKLFLKESFLGDYIKGYYGKEILNSKRFYNIGAGNQRSKFDFWSYIDLKSSLYSNNGIDIFYDLESLQRLPLKKNSAEVIFNSFVIEHISINATKNLCSEAFRVLRTGGVFHSKIHCYEYGYKLLNKGIISPAIPFDSREGNEMIDKFIIKHRGKIISYFNDSKEYVIQSIGKIPDQIIFSSSDTFILHNAVAAYQKINYGSRNSKSVLDDLNKGDIKEFYTSIRENFIESEKKLPHQHNADYFSKDELFKYIKDLGFSEVYFTQPYQSISPVLWEDNLNPIHRGFTFSIEAIK